MPHLEVHQRDDNRWGWRLTADNGRIIATDGGQGYENRADCQAMASAVVDGHYGNPTEEPRTVNTSHHVDIVIERDEPEAAAMFGIPEPDHADVAPDPRRRVIILAPTKQAGHEEARTLGIDPVAVITPRSIDAARGLGADDIIASASLSHDQRDELLTHALPSIATTPDATVFGRAATGTPEKSSNP